MYLKVNGNRAARLLRTLAVGITVGLGLFPSSTSQASDEMRLKVEDPRLAQDAERRFSGWVHKGADEQELDQVYRSVSKLFGSGPNSWVYENSKLGKKHEETANRLLSQGDVAGAAEELKIAATFYGIARFPFLHNQATIDAYKKHDELYLASLRLKGIPVQEINIPFEGKELDVHLFTSSVVSPKSPGPAVVVSGGIDSWKSEMWPTVEAMLAEGLVVLTMDMPGTGTSDWRLSADAEKVYSAAVDYLKSRPDVNPDQIGVNLRSYAGYFAVKLALLDPDVKAAVNFGGPIQEAYGENNLLRLPNYMLSTVGAGFGMTRKEFVDNPEKARAEMKAHTQKTTFEALGLLKPFPDQAALLSINGDNDMLVPVEDIYVLSKAGIRQEIWIYPGGGHTGGKFRAENIPAAAKWLKMQLTSDRPFR